jgi:hypothetical protein
MPPVPLNHSPLAKSFASHALGQGNNKRKAVTMGPAPRPVPASSGPLPSGLRHPGGSNLVLYNLTSANLNFRVVVVDHFDADRQRYRVVLLARGGAAGNAMYVKQINLDTACALRERHWR